MGEMGQLLADESFMAQLPKPAAQTWIYAGTKGLPGRLSPFGDVPNDGILSVAETQAGPEIPVIQIPFTHTFIMNSFQVAGHIVQVLERLAKTV